MNDTHSPGSLRAALQYMMSSNVPSDHKAVLIELLTSALREEDAQQRIDSKPAARVDGPWQDTETKQLHDFLNGKTATSWQHADELLMQLSMLLGRDRNYLRNKATALGYGEGVDYRLAKARASERAQTEE